MANISTLSAVKPTTAPKAAKKRTSSFEAQENLFYGVGQDVLDGNIRTTKPLFDRLNQDGITARGLVTLLTMLKNNLTIATAAEDDLETEPPLSVGAVGDLIDVAIASAESIWQGVEHTADWANEYAARRS